MKRDCNLEVRRVPDTNRYAVFDGDERVSGMFSGLALAEDRRDSLQRERRQKTERPCITCSAVFKSEGPRMCKACRCQRSAAVTCGLGGGGKTPARGGRW